LSSDAVVPPVMNLDHPYLVALADTPEGAGQVAWLDRQAAAGGEDQAGVGPGAPEYLAANCLLLLPQEQCGADQCGNGQVALPGAGLDWALVQAVVDALEVLAHPEGSGVQVHVAPAQSEDLAAAHPVDDQQDEGRVQQVNSTNRETPASQSRLRSSSPPGSGTQLI
jgi:hypothetical protein